MQESTYTNPAQCKTVLSDTSANFTYNRRNWLPSLKMDSDSATVLSYVGMISICFGQGGFRSIQTCPILSQVYSTFLWSWFMTTVCAQDSKIDQLSQCSAQSEPNEASCWMGVWDLREGSWWMTGSGLSMLISKNRCFHAHDCHMIEVDWVCMHMHMCMQNLICTTCDGHFFVWASLMSLNADNRYFDN